MSPESQDFKKKPLIYSNFATGKECGTGCQGAGSLYQFLAFRSWEKRPDGTDRQHFFPRKSVGKCVDGTDGRQFFPGKEWIKSWEKVLTARVGNTFSPGKSGLKAGRKS